MSLLYIRTWCLVSLAAAFVGVPNAHAVSFAVLSYNIHGLPPQIEISPGVFVDGNPDSPTTIPQIATALGNNLGSWDVVAIQEAFVPEYYDAVNAPSPNTPPIDTPVPPALAASGLTRLSQTAFSGFVRETWSVCGPNRGDCLADKGFSMARHMVAGEIVDIYNLHADAGQESEDIAARNAQLVQLADRIITWSHGNAVIVIGDTNSLFNRGADTIDAFLSSAFLADAWVELMNGGVVPAGGTSPVSGCANDAETDPVVCERIDKILYRGSNTLTLTATGYSVPASLFQDMAMNDLSDHRPVEVIFEAQASPQLVPALEPLGTALLLSLLGATAWRVLSSPKP